MITLAYPWLLGLLLLPLILRPLVAPRRTQRAAVRIPFMERLAQRSGMEPSEGSVVRRRTTFQAALAVATWCAVCVALARPQWIEEPLVEVVPSRDLLLAVDLSGSMEAVDFTAASGEQVDRLTAVKEVVGEFLERREGDRVGLIVFGTAAFVQAPFTQDLNVCRTLLDETQVRMAGPRTALGDAIGLSLSLFEESEVEDRVLIVLTDGNDTGSAVPPARAAEIARDRGVVVNVVAVGDPEATGEEALDLQTLQTVADSTGGAFFHAEDRAGLEASYARLDELGTRELETVSYSPRHELYVWPIAAVTLATLLFHLVAIVQREAPAGGAEPEVPDVG